MFIGHFAVGLGAKTLQPKLSLGSYFLAAQFVDLLWPTLLIFKLEEVAIAPGITEMTPLDFVRYPFTHSLVMALLWSVLGAAIVFMVKREWWPAIVLGCCVGSHWILDFITHRPDLPLTLSEEVKVGLGLWNNKVATVVVEFVLFGAATAWYASNTNAQNKIGSIGFWSLIGFLVFIHIGNIFGPPPPSVEAIAWAGHLQWLFVAWAYWVDGNRKVID